MSDELLAKYKKLSGDLVTLEAAIVATKAQRAEIAKGLLEANGKSHVYEIDGVAMVITTSATGTRYFTPKDKWAASGKPKKAKAPKPPKEKKVKPKKAIVGGRVVEVTATLTAKASAVEAAPEPAPVVPEALPEPVAAEPVHSMTRGHVTPENPKAPVQVTPEPKELDAVEAALAAIEGLDV